MIILKNTQIKFLNGPYNIEVEFPNLCPHCGRTMVPECVSKSHSDEKISYDEKAKFALTFRCSYNDCKKYFAVEYFLNEDGIVKQINYSYRPPVKTDFPKKIIDLSNMFVSIYSQSAIAESEHLDLIAGVGYRKAAEFLIKDYAIHKSPENEDKICKQPLGQVIQDYFNDFTKLKNLATAIAWIGNDETHYVRKHDDKDLHDLKLFIDSAVYFISADLNADEALSFTSK